MKPYFSNTLILLVGIQLMTGCATITRGTTEAFVVESDPMGADVYFSSGERCMTPCALERKRKDNFVITIKKDGYQDAQVSVVSQTAGGGAAGMAGNLIFGGLIGAAVDAGSGSTKELIPNPVRVQLLPVEGRPESTADEDEDESGIRRRY